MSNAKKCNRCGAPYTIDILDERDNITAISVPDKHGRDVRAFGYDLCPKCRKEFTDWLDILKKEGYI